MNRLSSIVLIILLTPHLLSPSATAQTELAEIPGELTIALSSQALRIAEPFQLRIACVVEPGVRVKFPEFGTQWGAFEVIDRKEQFDIPQADGQRLWNLELTLETLETGSLQTPNLEVLLGREGASSRRLVAPPQALRVTSVLEPNADVAKIRDIKPLIAPQETEAPPSGGWTWPVTGAALALGACLLVWRRGRKTLTPVRWANLELDALVQRLGAESPTAVHFEQLTTIVGRFLQWQLDYTAPSWTTADLLRAPQVTRWLDEADLAAAQTLLELTDRVKYANAVPTNAEATEAIQWCRRFVEQLATSSPEANS